MVSDKSRSRLFDSIEAALRLAEGYAIVDVMVGKNISSANTIHVPFAASRWANYEPRLLLVQCAVWSVSGV